MYERKKREGVQLAYPFEEKRLMKWSPPYIVQPKLDGIRCRAVRLENGYVLFSSTEEVIFSVPHILDYLNNYHYLDVELDGELYVHGWSFEDIYSVTSRTTNLHLAHSQVQFHIFDIVLEDTPQMIRSVELNSLAQRFEKTDVIQIVPHAICETFQDILNCYQEYLNMGYEGIIVRHTDAPYMRKRSTYMMKFKPTKTDTYQIVGYKQEVDKNGFPKDRLGALICTSDDGTEFSVGSGFTDQQRHELWLDKESLPGYNCTIEYQHLTPGRKCPRFPIFVSIEEDS